MLRRNLYIDDRLLSENVFFCESWFENAKGLLGRMKLDDTIREAIVLYRCNSIHMFFMSYPIDVFFMTKHGVVRKVVREVKPWKLAGSLGSYYAIEVNTCASWTADISVGAKLTWRD